MSAGSQEAARIMDLSADLARIRLEQQHQRTERLILEGHNQVDIPYLPSEYPDDGTRLIYYVPGWRQQPLVRARIEWARFLYRRATKARLRRW